VFGQTRKLLDSPVHHLLKAVRQMITVASMNGHTLNAFSVELARSGAGAVIQARSFDLGKELVLKLARSCRFALPEQLHRFDFCGIVIDGHLDPFRNANRNAAIPSI
jgi:hypothetical protein